MLSWRHCLQSRSCSFIEDLNYSSPMSLKAGMHHCGGHALMDARIFLDLMVFPWGSWALWEQGICVQPVRSLKAPLYCQFHLSCTWWMELGCFLPGTAQRALPFYGGILKTQGGREGDLCGQHWPHVRTCAHPCVMPDQHTSRPA
jgi:hypothetical protein